MAIMNYWERLDPPYEKQYMMLVSYPVGKNANNWWTDIMLVQYLIRQIYLANSGTTSIRTWKLSSVSEFEISDLPNPLHDYKKLEKTTKWIRYFQTDATLMNGIALSADGRVDAHNIAIPGARHYTIHHLNLIFQKTFAKAGLIDWRTYVLADPSMPQALRIQLKSNKGFLPY